MKLRKIQPIELGPVKKATNFGKRPVLQWVEPTSLYVDESYQRDLTRRSIKLIKKTVENFKWNRMKPPIVTMDSGKMHVIDGQHTAIAAAILGIHEIPVFLVEADLAADRAMAFVGHNTDRIVVSSIGIYKAKLAAGDEAVVDIEAVCRRAGIRIAVFTQNTSVQIGDTMAIASISKLVARRGVMRARQVLECLVKAKRAPVSSDEITAAEQVLCVELPKLDFMELARVVRLGGDRGLFDARAKAHAERTQTWRVLAKHWASRLKVLEAA